MQHLSCHFLHHDQDVVIARQQAAHIATLLGFDVSDQTRVATAVSEIVRNAFRYAAGGRVEFHLDDEARPQRLVIEVRDHGPGIPHLSEVLDGHFHSATGLGIGIGGARRLMDRFAIQSSSRGTSVLLEKLLPVQADVVTRERAIWIAKTIKGYRPAGLTDELQRRNQELLRALDELQQQQEELVHLNRELEDTNRGVVALYAELDDKADRLRRADELKSRFLSNMTHEFRTPVNSITGLCNLLIEEAERESREPGPELLYIRQAADQLSELVNDLLDLAKVEAGKTAVRAMSFDVATLFGALRGMLRPLLVNQAVRLVFEEGQGIPILHTDEGKVSQILRNLISNALKYTEEGEVRVSARADDEGRTVGFAVADTGIGIAPEDQPRIFEEFAQVEHRLQGRVRGTGLGLPLSRRLAELLGGSLSVRSEPGVGSTFTLTVPSRYREAAAADAEREDDLELAGRGALPDTGERRNPDAIASRSGSTTPVRVLVVDDQEVARFLIRQCLPARGYEVVEAESGHEALRRVREWKPDAIVLDLIMEGMGGAEVLDRLREDSSTAGIPVVIATANELEAPVLAGLRRHAAAVLSKADLSRSTLEAVLRTVLDAKRRHAGVAPE
jgi:signal transduction histidine kinase/ActR/RegA family two-component response regulator